MKNLFVIAVLVVSVFMMSCSEESMVNSPDTSMNSSSDQPVSLTKPPSQSGNTIVDIAIAAATSEEPEFTVLVEAVVFAGLAETLSGNRQFTVFAPTDAAFLALLDDLTLTPEELFAPGNEDLVRKILLYHVAPGERFAADVVTSDRVRTMAKEFARVNVDGGAFIGNDKYGYAEIVLTDIDAANGVIHVLDKVIVPPSLDL
jgi:uncharacterized surface protein with fasciclin (FAS1) repeats